MVHTLLKKTAHLTGQYPPVIQPPGLSNERQAYLYQEIRDFVADEHRDLVCPRPLASKRKQPTVGEDTEGDSSADLPTPSTSSVVSDTATAEDVPTTSAGVKRQRGRPRKPAGRGRGRPRKN